MSIDLAAIAPAAAADLPAGAALPQDAQAPLPLAPPFAPAQAYNWLAQHAPAAVAVRRETPDGDGYQDVTNVEWAARIRRAAAYVRARTNDAPVSGGAQVVAFCAHADVLDYLCLTFGTELAGLVGLQLATNNSAPALAHLIRGAGAHALLAGPPGKAGLDVRVHEAVRLLSQDGWHVALIPWPAADVLTAGPQLDDPITPYEPERPMAILHSSGTTGMWPKLRVYTQRDVRQLQHWPYFSPPPRAGGVTFIGNLPPFHAMGQQAARAAPAFGTVLAGYVWALHPRPVDERSWTHALLSTRSDTAIAAPVVYENVLQDHALLALLRRVPTLVYGGALMAPHSLRTLSQHGIHLHSFFGTTEVNCISSLSFAGGAGIRKTNMAHAFIQPIPGDEEGAVEMLWYGAPYFAPLLYNGECNGRPTYSTGDRYRILSPAIGGGVVSTEQLPEVRFEILGRSDDQVPLSNGEKVNPAPILHALLAHPDVSHVIVFGKSRLRPGVLLELHSSSSLLPPSTQLTAGDWDAASLARAREVLWPLVEQANKDGPSHAHISREMVLFAQADRPFLLTGKGSVRTVPSLDLYAKEINEAYATSTVGASLGGIIPPAQWTERSALSYVCALLAACLEHDIAPHQQDNDLFQTLGADSIIATKVWQALATALRQDQLPSTLVYDHPTPAALAAAVHRIATGQPVAGNGTGLDPLSVMERLIARYGTFQSAAPARRVPKHTFIVTGVRPSAPCLVRVCN